MPLVRIICLLIATAVTAFSYSSDGHEIIADVAQDLIKGGPAEAKVRELLGHYTIAEVSTWADKIKGGNSPDADLNTWRDGNLDQPPGQSSARHNLHHYTNPAFQETEYSADLRGTSPDDLVHAMRDCILILRGMEPSASFKGTSPKVALILLIHYAGDLAQPLHVGEGYLNHENQWVNPKQSRSTWGTAGGNRLIWGTANLHYHWDKAVVDGAMRAAGYRDHPKEYARFLADQSQQNSRLEDMAPPHGSVEDWPLAFASIMLPKVRPVYEGVKIVSFDGKKWTIEPPSDQYNQMAVKATETNLRVGGEQLAEILEAIWPGGMP